MCNLKNKQFNEMIKKFNNYFFIGIAGAGMSAIAQYLKGIGKNVSGSDRQFSGTEKMKIQKQLENEGIKCFPQDTSGLNKNIEIVIISTAVEPTVPEYKKAIELNIPVVMRSDLLAEICKTKKTIAVSGTSGKSTVTALIYHILEKNGTKPSMITGAGLSNLQEKGKIGNAVANSGEYLVIEADESDGSLVKYKPETGLILNIEKDHKELDELNKIFAKFVSNVKNILIVNADNRGSKKFSRNKKNDFGYSEKIGICGHDFVQNNFKISFKINNIPFESNLIGKHNMENILASVSAAFSVGISLEKSAEAVKTYKGIYRRHQIIGTKNGITLIDDYAHNPAKLSASIKSCTPKKNKLFVWFQPHGFAPVRFLRNEFVKEITEALREKDEIYMSEIYYAGGSVTKNISSADLINDIKKTGKNAFYIKNRNDFPKAIKSKMQKGDVVLLTGARDLSLSNFAYEVFEMLF